MAGVTDAEPGSPLANPSDADGVRFEHLCHCGAWGYFGYDVALLRGRVGTWYCAEHRPEEEDVEPWLKL